jgi:hypothetical protein
MNNVPAARRKAHRVAEMQEKSNVIYLWYF